MRICTDDPAYEASCDPATGSWTTMAGLTSLSIPLTRWRLTGRLSRMEQLNHRRQEIYSPHLFHGSVQLSVSAHECCLRAVIFWVPTPPAFQASPHPATWLTHGFNMSQHISRPPFSQATDGVNVALSTNTTPPGYYMLFILNSNGVPRWQVLSKFSNPPTPTPTPN
jgi:hypothetical protein